jgi:TolA-binding protein
MNFHSRFTQSLVIMCAFVGCTGVTSVPSELSSPLFAPTTEDTANLSKLSHELDNRALHCLDTTTCGEVHFARALVSLFENQEAARASFRRVIDDHPSSALAVASRLWLQLIGEKGTGATSAPKPHNTLMHLMAQSIRDWMARELTQYPKVQQAESMATEKPGRDSAAVMLGLQRQVRERDRRIAVLESKLEALKTIDQDQEQRKRAVKVPSTLP